MSLAIKKKNIKTTKRKLRVRKKLRGSVDKPRLCVVKSNKNIFVQLIDDQNGKTLASTSTVAKEYKNTETAKKNKSSAKTLGTKIAELAKTQNIEKVVFDRGEHKYHGILAELADAARSAGLQF
jgi:large subunit ribosomal protein L18